MNAWLFQDLKQKQKLGDKCPWSVGWYDPEGKRKGKKIGSKSLADKFRQRLEGQLAAGIYQDVSKKSWADFRAEYESRALVGAAAGTRDIARRCLAHFERVVRPVRVGAVTTRTFAEYVATRRGESVRNGAQATSPATINKELRHLRAVVRKAHKWGYLARIPEIDFLKEPGKLATYVTPEHFAELYQHADAARWPSQGPFSVADWWRALLVTAYMTGWRIGSLMALRREDVSLDEGWAISRAEDNKGKRDQRVPLHPIVVEHMRKLAGFSPLVFSWDHARRSLFDEFQAIQTAAGVKPEGSKPRYGFHDLRRAFATMNADKLTADVLQSLMQHKAYATTQRYINLARQLNPAVQTLFVPDLPHIATG